MTMPDESLNNAVGKKSNAIVRDAYRYTLALEDGRLIKFEVGPEEGGGLFSSDVKAEYEPW